MERADEFRTLEAREWALYSQRGDYFTRWFGLPVSLRITNIYLKLGLNENHASASMFITGLIGAALMILGPWGIFLGASFLVLHHLFDYVDGQIARHYGRASVNGAVLDRWNHFLVEAATFPCLGVGLYLESGQIWPLVAVWFLYIWNRFRVLLAQLPANILSEELSQYPEFERDMMRANLAKNKAASLAPNAPIADPQQNTQKPKATLRAYCSRMRVASTSYNGFTLVLWFGALLDLLAQQVFSQDGAIETIVILMVAYAVFNLLDYSWTYLRSDKVARELRSRLKGTL